MCGITGFWNTNGNSYQDSYAILKAMSDRIESRGPDSEGAWYDAMSGLGFGHRRLAVVDLSPTGQQPMHSASGQSVIAYNGEIYNSEELRNELKNAGVLFKGGSDTEVLLEACECWGVEETVKRCVGMFAFAFWDSRNKRLTLVRDRVGIKPLYYGSQNGCWFFASQPKSIIAHPGFNARINRRVMARFVQFAYVPGPDCIYEDLLQLRPGHLIHIDANGQQEMVRYWDLPKIAKKNSSHDYSKPQAEVTQELHLLLKDAVSRRMISEVPLGAFLSGGVDSSIVVALMQEASEHRVRTFSVGFHEQGFNEAEHAALVARHLGTEHAEMYVSHQQVLDIIPRIAESYDEPFGDSSQLPTQMLCALTRNEVTVALSGDGGDELFAGYNRYLLSERIRNGYSSCPFSMRKIAAGLIRQLSPMGWDCLSSLIPESKRPPMFGDKLHKLAGIIGLESFGEVYPGLLKHWPDGEAIVLDHTDVDHPIGWEEGYASVEDSVMKMQLMDMLSYLPDDILTKVDRSSMGVGLEARVPLLDHRVVEYAWRLPLSAKISAGKGKLILRDILYQYVPRELIERPKMGFGVPLDAWLRGSLRDWAEDLLDPASLSQDDMFAVDPIRKRWDEHLKGTRNWQYSLWNVLMAQAWRKTWT